MRQPMFIQNPIKQLPSVKELWQQLKEKAEQKTLDNKHLSELRGLYTKYTSIIEENKDYRHSRSTLSELREIREQINKICEEYGYPSYDAITYQENGKVGLLDFIGNKQTEALYDEFSFTYDDRVFINPYEYVVRKGDKWGIVNNKGEEVCPFEYDFIIRVPNTLYEYILTKDGKQGLFDKELILPCVMDSIHIPNYKTYPFFFVKDGKWGWYWENDDEFYQSYSEPLYDEIFYMSEDEWDTLTDEDEEFFEARIADETHYILEWSWK